MSPFRTDLTMEAAEAQHRQGLYSLPGVEERTYDREGCGVTSVRVTSAEGAKLLDKPIGSYVTLDLSDLARREPDAFARSVRAVAAELSGMLPANSQGCVLVVGLGNRMVTPDAVGPRVADQILVTRHLLRQEPERFAPFRPVCAIATGVLGTTGIESVELVEAAVSRVRPELVIAVDALAARSAQRLCTTVQIGDTGIVPGSGIGNAREALDRQHLGVPVIAMGIPTVVEAATLAMDLTGQEGGGDLSDLLVTPKDIDVQLSDLSKVVGYGINLALQEGLEIEDIDLLLS